MPSLADTVSDVTPEQWILNDFTAYLSRNHCLETLQFVQDASRYRACYTEIVGSNKFPCEYFKCHYDYLQALWEDLLESYILPNAHREVNLPSNLKDRLIEFRYSALLPHPSELDDAVNAVYELMEDAIVSGMLSSPVPLEQPCDGGRGVWKRISGRLRRKISKSMTKSVSERDLQTKFRVSEGSELRSFCLGRDGADTFYTRRHSLEGASPLPRSHLLQRVMEVVDHTVLAVWSTRWLKPLPDKERAEVDIGIGTRDQYVGSKPLE